jgi:nitrate reductase gamma subunit
MTGDTLLARWPLAALVIALGGFAIRLLMARPIDPRRSDVTEARAIFGGTRCWRVAAGLLLVTHVVMIAAPRAILTWNAVPLRLYLLEGSGFLLGGVAIGACCDVTWRHATRPSTSAKSAVADSVFLGLLLVALASGFFTQTLFRWASSWGAMTLAPYVGSVLRGAPREHLVDEMPFVVRLHVVSSFAVLAAFPFTRAALLSIVAVRRILRIASAPIGLALSSLERRCKERAAAFIWAEEDTDPEIVPPDSWVPGRSGISPAPSAIAREARHRGAFHETIDQAR